NRRGTPAAGQIRDQLGCTAVEHDRSGCGVRALSPYARGAPHTELSPQDCEAGWRLLFDVRTTVGWRRCRKDEMPAGWQVIDGALPEDAGPRRRRSSRRSFTPHRFTLIGVLWK